MARLKYFFNFLIEIEEVEMKNPFETYESLSVPHSNIETLTKEFLINNLKVKRNYKTKTGRQKVIPVTPDFEDFLIELGMNDNPNPNDYVLRVDRTQTLQTIMDRISKAFTHYAEGAGIKKNVSLRHLRKTYITWMNQAMGIETGKLTSQTEGVMNNYYIDPKIVALGERAARDLRIFGENGTISSRTNLTHKQKRLHDFS